MTHTTIKHWAYNLITGEVLGCSTGNGLKRRVQHSNRWGARHGYELGSWIFFHCSDAELRQRFKERVG